MKNLKVLKGAVVLLIATVVLFSNLSVIADTQTDLSMQTNKMKKLSFTSLSSSRGSFETIIDENFTDQNIPPEGEEGKWDIKSAGGKTWIIEKYRFISLPCSVHVRRGDNINHLDEWLITPSLDFSGYVDKDIFLSFYFMGDKYSSINVDSVDYNVKVSINNGGNWDLVWNEADIPFGEWYSQNWTRVDNIPLTKYAGNSSVLIGFQFKTKTNESRESQYFYIDDIRAYTTSEDPLTCSPGGPYEWWWESQTYYTPWGVRFQGSINDGPWWQYKWEWDFGDGNFSNVSTPFAIHYYDLIGTYTVRLRVTHRSTGIFAIANTTVLIYTGPPSEIDIDIIWPSIGIKAEIKNLAEYNATNVNCTITVARGGSLGLFRKVVGEETIERLAPDGSKLISSNKYFFGFLIHITITLKPDNMYGSTEEFSALKIGPFIIFAG